MCTDAGCVAEDEIGNDNYASYISDWLYSLIGTGLYSIIVLLTRIFGNDLCSIIEFSIRKMELMIVLKGQK